ncbi:hypothetical protein MWU60_01710 [Yoonia sp. F2084L]|uniref:hypothetical protein n=1 Tax=Yoonia sp. F2084L TaxID=2926419 RepID=UPI001FF435D6|nr:hypothetical protein [Yoonia sp. F2084L]MCK0094272.1 hypothetical protein [Yoonia sp. F2084L]
MTGDAVFDPKGLIREAFAIEDIGAPECRSIFLDWALGLPAGRDAQDEVRALLAHYGPLRAADHPMVQTLTAALEDAQPARRRGGRNGRVPPDL